MNMPPLRVYAAGDTIRGGLGTDFAFGQGGFDLCTAENESGCEG